MVLLPVWVATKPTGNVYSSPYEKKDLVVMSQKRMKSSPGDLKAVQNWGRLFGLVGL